MRKVTRDVTIGSLLYGIAPQPLSQREEKAVAFARNLISGSNTKGNTQPMLSVFTHLNGEHPGMVIFPRILDEKLVLPGLKSGAGETAASVLEKLKKEVAGSAIDTLGLSGLLRVLEAYLSTLPSPVTQDISLYDYAKTTTAVAASLVEYLDAQQGEECARRFDANEARFRDEKAFLLYSADFSGIQKFIFTVATKGALPSLRSRSFFLEFLMEHYMDELLTACGVSRANLLYSGGGHCYLLLPHTEAVVKTLQSWNTQFNDWLGGQFGIQLFVAHGWTACSGNDLVNVPGEKAPYTAMFRRVSSAIGHHKLHRYTPAQVIKLNEEYTDVSGRECNVCGRSDNLKQNGRCLWCNLFVELSGKVLDCPVYLVSREQREYDFVLPGWDAPKYIAMTDERDALLRLKQGEAVERMYTKNRVFASLPQATRLYVGEYAAARQMSELAAGSTGITRLAVCRMDVDNLGHAFVAGYRRVGEKDVKKRDAYVNICRTAAFSRQMSLFFKCYINHVLKEPAEDGGKLSVAIVYSGGDDVFLVGAWQDVITAAQRIQSSFEAFCGGALTISGGITLHDDHFPIRQAGAQCAQLEEAAKREPEKNSLALFEEEGEHIYSWKLFKEQVMGEKMQVLEDFFKAEEQERGNAFLYQLLELLRLAQEDKIHLARYAYLLARMEPREKSRQESYRAFSKSMYSWALNREDRRQLITAIYLYVYKERSAA